MKKKLLVFAALLVLALVCVCVAFADTVYNEATVERNELGNITKILTGDGREAVVVGQPIILYDETCYSKGRAEFNCNLIDGVDDQGQQIIGDTAVYHVWIQMHAHTMSSTTGQLDWGRVVEPATCTNAGYAVDVCVCDDCDCDYEDTENKRIIAQTAHAYDDDHIITPYYKEPSCNYTGLAQHYCIYCGEPQPDETEDEMFVVPKIEHNWSDWLVKDGKDSTCAKYGEAKRVCTRCFYEQILNENTSPIYDQGTPITIQVELPLKNPLWNKNLDGKDYTSQQALDAALEGEGFKYEIKRSWLNDCYTRELTYTCPYCHGEEKDENGNIVHPDFTVTLSKPATISHTFILMPDGEADGNHSVAPTCTEDGYDLYLCKFDHVNVDGGQGVHGHPAAPLTEAKKDDTWYTEVRPALDHDWGEWFPSEVYRQGDQEFLASFRTCERCGNTETKVEPYENPDVKQGLVEDKDGVWRYYKDGEVDYDFTKLVVFQGGEFWVVNGVVPPDAHGLTICPDGKAYFLHAGQIQRKTQWAAYNEEWFVIKNGELDKVTGLLNYDGGTFAVVDGRKIKELNGLWCDPTSGKWAFIAGGQVATWFTGETTYDGHSFKVEKGYLAN